MDKYTPEESRDNEIPELDFQQIIKPQRKASTDVGRQITVTHYRTRIGFDSEMLESALQKCKLRPSDEIGMINMRSSRENSELGSKTTGDGSIDLDVGQDWVRSLFGIIGEKGFRWLDLKTRNIYEYLITGTLNETFLVEFYRNIDNEVRFFTYGGSRHGERINRKLKEGFRIQWSAERVEFGYDFVRERCSHKDFRKALNIINYSPVGEAEYGTVDSASMKTNYKKVIDPDAAKVKEILENPKILIGEFGAKFTMYIPELMDKISVQFELSKRGLVTLTLPEITFPRPMLDIERENTFYKVVRRLYVYIAGSQYLIKAVPNTTYQVFDQLAMFAGSADEE